MGGNEEALLVAEIVDEESRANARLLGDVAEGCGFVAASAESLTGRLQDRLSVSGVPGRLPVNHLLGR